MQVRNKLSLKNAHGILESWRTATLYSDITCNETSFLKHTENLLFRAGDLVIWGGWKKKLKKMTSQMLIRERKSLEFASRNYMLVIDPWVLS